MRYALCAILLLGAFLRFRGLNWGLPYPFHPDERNMAVAVAGFSSKNLDPQFYAYGQFPLYLAYFSSRFLSFWFPAKFKEILSLEQSILFLRFWSAFFSTATIYLTYLIGKKVFSKNLFSIFFFIFSISFAPGLIQAAHFGTTESLLTFCFLTVLYFSLNILEKPCLKNYLGAAFFLGIALGSKISAAAFAFPLVLATIWQLKNQKGIKERLLLFPKTLFFLSLSLSLALLTSPYLLLAYRNSRSALLYEIAVAQGISRPFYTRQFKQTTPVIFQLTKIFPYALGLPIFILGAIGTLAFPFSFLKKIVRKSKPSITNYQLLITFISFLLYFLSNSFLFAKWTRFMTPVFPFFSLFATYLLVHLGNLTKKNPLITQLLIFLIILSCLIPGLIFSQIYFKPDIRFTASDWIYKNIPSGSQVLFDTANVVDIPVQPPNYPITPLLNYSLKMISFNFYDLDQSKELYENLLNYLENSDYIIVPSRRVFINHLRFPEKYPLVTKYFQLLFSEKLGFKEIKTFYPFPEFSFLASHFSFSDERSEETFTVFDHPVIRIYQKVANYNKDQYEKLFQEN